MAVVEEPQAAATADITFTIKDANFASRLRERAKHEGRDVGAVIETIIASGLEATSREYEQSVQAIQQGLDDFAAGQAKPLAQVVAETRARHGLPSAWPFEQPSGVSVSDWDAIEAADDAGDVSRK